LGSFAAWLVTLPGDPTSALADLSRSDSSRQGRRWQELTNGEQSGLISALRQAVSGGSTIPGGGSAFEAYCKVKYFSPRSWRLTFASDFAEFARQFSVRIAAHWRSALLWFVHTFPNSRNVERRWDSRRYF
jgi:hypothetical protein